MKRLSLSESVLRALYPQDIVITRLRGVLAAWRLTNHPFQPIWSQKNFSKIFEKIEFQNFLNFRKIGFFEKFFYRIFSGYFSDFPNIFRILRISDISGSARVFRPEKKTEKNYFSENPIFRNFRKFWNSIFSKISENFLGSKLAETAE